MVTMADLHPPSPPITPAFAELIRRYGSAQVRAAATIGGNIANGSPIGDGPPRADRAGRHAAPAPRRHPPRLPLEDFFLDLRQTGPRTRRIRRGRHDPPPARPAARYKISKRFDQDISALLRRFNITVDGGTVTEARIAFGGMAGTPKRARRSRPPAGPALDRATIDAALPAFAEDFTPLTTCAPRPPTGWTAARNLLMRYFLEGGRGHPTNVLEVQP
jgi:xanthine dehydrogenase small subunit